MPFSFTVPPLLLALGILTFSGFHTLPSHASMSPTVMQPPNAAAQARLIAKRIRNLPQTTRLEQEEGWNIVSIQGTGTDRNVDQTWAFYSEGGDCSREWSLLRRDGRPVMFTYQEGCEGEMPPANIQVDSLFFDQGQLVTGTKRTVTTYGGSRPNRVKSTPVTNPAEVQWALDIGRAMVAVDTASLNRLVNSGR